MRSTGALHEGALGPLVVWADVCASSNDRDILRMFCHHGCNVRAISKNLENAREDHHKGGHVLHSIVV
jgi:hypothetical protein